MTKTRLPNEPTYCFTTAQLLLKSDIKIAEIKRVAEEKATKSAIAKAKKTANEEKQRKNRERRTELAGMRAAKRQAQAEEEKTLICRDCRKVRSSSIPWHYCTTSGHNALCPKCFRQYPKPDGMAAWCHECTVPYG
jgi:uncharacterized protein YbaR (Trm112 family)